jgi:outer membrane protein assembly factor BamB
VATSWTTRCCSAIAVLVIVGAALNGQGHTPAVSLVAPAPPLALFPIRPVWTLALNNVLVAPPGFGENRGFFPIEGDRVAAYDLQSGTLLWTASARPVSEPVAGEGLVFIAEANGIVAFDAATGAEAWRLPVVEPLAVRLVWQDGWLIAAAPDGTIGGYRAQDGEMIWSRALGVRPSAPPSVAADRVYVPTEDGRLFALRADNGEPTWEQHLPGALHDVLALDDRLYVGSTDNFLYCLRTRDGRIDWRWRTGADVVGQPIADAERVYFVSLDNVLRALDRVSGGQRWKSELDLRPRGGPRWAGDTILVTGISPAVVGFRTSDGAAIGGEKLGAELAAPPYALEGKVLPTFVAVTRDIAKGATVFAFTRSVEPRQISPLAPLPNPVQPPPVRFQ